VESELILVAAPNIRELARVIWAAMQVGGIDQFTSARSSLIDAMTADLNDEDVPV
jgi:hypothetical protein